MSEKVVLDRIPADRYEREDRYKLMSVGEDFVSVASSRKIAGQNVSGKTYVRFHTDSVKIFKLGEYPDGRPRVNVYEKTHQRLRHNGGGSRKTFQNITPTLTSPHAVRYDQYDAVGMGEFLKLYEAKYGPTGQFPTSMGLGRLAYPILTTNDKWKYTLSLGSALRMSDARGFIETAFGKTRYRKDLVKAVAATHSTSVIAVMSAFRGVVPTDWLVDALNDWPKFGEYDWNFASLRKIAKLTDQNSARRLLNGLMSDQVPSMWITDSIRSIDQLMSYRQIPELGKVSGWREVHDLLAGQARRAVKPNQTIPQRGKVIKALDGAEVSGYTIVSAKDTDTLEVWGHQMSNCIGGYEYQALNGTSLLFGVYRDGSLVGNMELRKNGDVVQLVGKYNARFPDSALVSNRVHELTGYNGHRALETVWANDGVEI